MCRTSSLPKINTITHSARLPLGASVRCLSYTSAPVQQVPLILSLSFQSAPLAGIIKQVDLNFAPVSLHLRSHHVLSVRPRSRITTTFSGFHRCQASQSFPTKTRFSVAQFSFAQILRWSLSLAAARVVRLSRKGESHPLALIVVAPALLRARDFTVLAIPGGDRLEHPLRR